METKATVEELMKLIAELNRWGNQSSSVTIGYMPARVHTAQDESHLDYSNWGWTASTTICGMDKLSVGAQDKTLEGALLSLAKAIPGKIQQMSQSYNESFLSASKKLESFLTEMKQRQ